MKVIRWVATTVAVGLLAAGCAGQVVADDTAALEVVQPTAAPSGDPGDEGTASMDPAAMNEALRDRAVVGDFHQVGDGEDPNGRPYFKYGTDQYTHSRAVDPTAAGGPVVTIGAREPDSVTAEDFPPGVVVEELTTDAGVPAFGFAEDGNPRFTHLEVPLGQANLLLAGSDVSVEELLVFANEALD